MCKSDDKKCNFGVQSSISTTSFYLRPPAVQASSICFSTHLYLPHSQYSLISKTLKNLFSLSTIHSLSKSHSSTSSTLATSRPPPTIFSTTLLHRPHLQIPSLSLSTPHSLSKNSLFWFSLEPLSTTPSFSL